MTSHSSSSSSNHFKQQQSSLVTSQEKPIAELISMGLRRPRLVIKRGVRGFGFVLRAIKVFTDDTAAFTIQHLVLQVDEQGPAYKAGLRANDLITHVNDQVVCGKMHHELIKLIMANHTLCMHTCQLAQSNVKTNGRRRYGSPATAAAAKFVSARPFQASGHSSSQQQAQFRPVKSYYFRNSPTSGKVS